MCKSFRDSYVPFKYFGIWYDQKEGFPGGTSGKEPACQGRSHKRHRFDARVGKIPWRSAWQPPQYSCLENIMDRGAWRAAVLDWQSWTQLKQLSTRAHGQKQPYGTTLPRAQHKPQPGHFVCIKVTQSCPTLCDPTDCSLPGSSVHGILQARILKWVVIPFLQGIFPTQGSNSSLPHCRQIL